jgi:hypothetical protein
MTTNGNFLIGAGVRLIAINGVLLRVPKFRARQNLNRRLSDKTPGPSSDTGLYPTENKYGRVKIQKNTVVSAGIRSYHMHDEDLCLVLAFSCLCNNSIEFCWTAALEKKVARMLL